MSNPYVASNVQTRQSRFRFQASKSRFTRQNHRIKLPNKGRGIIVIHLYTRNINYAYKETFVREWSPGRISYTKRPSVLSGVQVE